MQTFNEAKSKDIDIEKKSKQKMYPKYNLIIIIITIIIITIIIIIITIIRVVLDDSKAYIHDLNERTIEDQNIEIDYENLIIEGDLNEGNNDKKQQLLRN